jgi:hypothetical protein
MSVDDTQPQGALNRATGLPFSDSTTTVSPQINTSQVPNTPERQAFVNKEQVAFQDQAAAEKAGALREAEIAQQQAAIMRPQIAQDEQYALERERIRQEHATRIAEAQTLQRQRIDMAMKDPGGYWDNKTSFDKTMTRILIGFGAMGAGDNKVLSLVNDEIEKDLKSKQQRSERLFKQAELARGYMSDALRARAEELSDLDTNRAALWNIVAKRTELAAKSGMAGKLTAEMAAKVATIQQAAAQAGIKASEAVATKVDVQGGHTSTTQAIGNKNAGSPTKDAKEVSKADYMAKMAEEAEQGIQQGGLPSAEHIRQIEKDTTKTARNAETSRESGFAQEAIGIGKQLGVVPRTEYTNVPPLVGQTHSRLVEMAEQQITDDLGARVISNPDLVKGEMRRRLPNADDTPTEAKRKSAAIIERGRHMKDIIGGTASGQKIEAADAARSSAPNSPTTAQARTQIETIPQLIAKGKAAKAAGNLKEAQRIHEQVKGMMGGGQ